MYNRNGTYIYFHISVSEVHVMNLQQLRYAVEVAKTGSITAAAKNLYMGQPNLSKNIRELEAELGITLFERTARGVAPTKNGEDFLGYARSIIAQMESLETMFGPHTETGTQLSVCAPRASYVAQAFSRYLGAEGRAPLQVQYRETSFDFISRLMEQEGIYYWFRHEQSRHILVLSDAYGAHQSPPNYASVPYLSLIHI